MESPANSRRRISAALAALLLLLLLCLLYQPKAISEVDLAQRRAQLDEAIRQRDEIPVPASSSRPITPAEVEPAVAVEQPDLAHEPVLLKQPAPPQDTYMDGVHRYLHQMELRHYDDMAQRKENFNQLIKAEENQIARQWKQLENFQAPKPRVILSAAVKQRMAYCIRCHDKKDSRDLAEFFARADDFH